MVRKSNRVVFSAITCLALFAQTTNAAVVATDRKALKEQQKQEGAAGDRGPRTKATGSQTLTDSGGLKYFINTNITFNTTSSASGALSEASFVAPVPADTLNGGVASSTLNDAFDGYNSVCLSLNNTVANCQTGNANFVIFNNNGPASLDATCNNRQVIFPAQASGNISMQRKVFVPSNDTFVRHQNIFTNTGPTSQTITVVMANNLGSDSNTKIVASSAGAASPLTSTATTWISSFQNWSGNTSSDVRLGFALQSVGAATPLAGLNFADGDDNPYWGYTLTIPAGQRAILTNFTTGQATRALAQSKATQLAAMTNPNQWNCMTQADQLQVRNFAAARPEPTMVPTLSTTGLAALLLTMLGAGIYFRKRREIQ